MNFNASWIWHAPLENMDNLHLFARKIWKLDKPPSRAECRVSANSFYELYINNRRVSRGPSRSYPKWQYADVLDVTPYLQEGVNVVAARCYNFGPTMKSVLGQDPGRGGFLMQIDADGASLITDSGWKVLQDPSRRQATEPISGHRGAFKEVCDGRREVLGWMSAGFDDSSWQDAHVLGPAGTMPWENLIPSEIPPLATERVLPRDVFYHTCGAAYGSAKYDVSFPEALRTDDESCAVVHPLKPDFAPSVILDFGVNVYGYFEVEIAESSGGVMELSFGESLNLTLIDRYIMREGAQTYGPFERRGGRYLALTFRDCPGPVQIKRVACRRQSYPVEYAGEFKSSDELLNRIWEVGRYTVQMCMQDQYEDCPWREQSLYAGDIAVGGLLSYYAFGTRDLARKCLRQFARIQADNGEIPSVGPAPGKQPWCLPEYPAFWVIAVWLHYNHWNDLDLVRELYPNVLRCMEWYQARLDGDGLFARRDGRFSRFVDNLSNIAAEDRLAAEQIVYSRSISCAADMAEALGDGLHAAVLRERQGRLVSSIERLFWNEERRCLIDSLMPGGDTVTQITNGLGALYGILSPGRREDALRVLMNPSLAPPVRAGYMNFYMVEALAGCGMHREALGRIREYWGGMLERGATTFWETFDPDNPEGTIPERLWSLCHEFCSGPVYSLPAHFAGIRALSPGFSRMEIAPNMCDLDWVKAAVPTPAGAAKITCCRNRATSCVEMDAEIPAGCEAEVLVPMPGRDAGTVYVDGRPVPPEQGGREEGGTRLLFKASPEHRRISISTRRERAFAPGGVVVKKSWDEWGSAPS